MMLFLFTGCAHELFLSAIKISWNPFIFPTVFKFSWYVIDVEKMFHTRLLNH